MERRPAGERAFLNDLDRDAENYQESLTKVWETASLRYDVALKAAEHALELKTEKGGVKGGKMVVSGVKERLVAVRSKGGDVVRGDDKSACMTKYPDMYAVNRLLGNGSSKPTALQPVNSNLPPFSIFSSSSSSSSVPR